MRYKVARLIPRIGEEEFDRFRNARTMARCLGGRLYIRFFFRWFFINEYAHYIDPGKSPGQYDPTYRLRIKKR